MKINIRSEIPSDESAIEAVTRSAFRNASHSSHTEHHIINELRKAQQLSVSLVAELDGVVVGHVAVSPVVITDSSQNWYGLGPLSVVPEQQGKSIGSLLMNEVLTLLKLQGASGCVLLGEPDYYSRFGFEANTNLVLPGVPQEYFQALSFDGEVAKGEVTYHEAFLAQG